jgi:hypothetical protein
MRQFIFRVMQGIVVTPEQRRKNFVLRPVSDNQYRMNHSDRANNVRLIYLGIGINYAIFGTDIPGTRSRGHLTRAYTVLPPTFVSRSRLI